MVLTVQTLGDRGEALLAGRQGLSWGQPPKGGGALLWRERVLKGESSLGSSHWA